MYRYIYNNQEDFNIIAFNKVFFWNNIVGCIIFLLCILVLCINYNNYNYDRFEKYNRYYRVVNKKIN